QHLLYIAGGLFILSLAYGAYKAWKDFDPTLPAAGSQQNILKGALMILISPGPYVYWSLVTGPVLLKGWRETPLHGLGFLAGFYVTVILSLATIIFVFGTAQKLGPKINRLLLGLSVIALFSFGLYELWQGHS